MFHCPRGTRPASKLPLPDAWRAEAGGYGLHRARFRQLPSDPQILEAMLRIPNPGWRLVYGLMATYGLRNHEVFFTDVSALADGGDRVYPRSSHHQNR